MTLLPSYYKNFQWKKAIYNGLHIKNWYVSENGILFNDKTGEIKYGHDNVKNKDLHQRVSIKHKLYYVERLVGESFIPNPKPGEYNVVRHKNDDPLNNHYTNLEWGTYHDNTMDAIRNGKIVYDENRNYVVGEKHPMSVLNDDSVKQICIMLKKETPISDIAKLFNVTRGTISHIYHGRTWKHISSEYMPFPDLYVYEPFDINEKKRIFDTVHNNPNISSTKLIQDLGLTKTNTILGYIGKVKRDIKSSTTRKS